MKCIYLTLIILFCSLNLLCQNITGIDVSHNQGAINWSQVYSSGKSFAFVKATEGFTYNDPNFVTNITNGTNAGLVMGAYHFGRPDNNSASNEASHFLSIASSYIGNGMLPPVLDIEDPYASSLSLSALSTWIQTWMTIVQNATGIMPILYTSSYYASNLNSSLITYKLWIANPGTSQSTPPTNIGNWNDWAFKQYSWTGSVSGIVGAVDLDVFHGSTNDFNALIYSTNPLCNNDNVCSPMSLTINTSGNCVPTPCSTVNATSDVSIPFNGTTMPYQPGRYDDDVWFSITPNTTNPLTIRVTPTSNTSNFDVCIGLYSGSCSNPTQVDCADLYGLGVTENLYFTPAAYTTYLIRVFSYGIGSQYSGNFDICVFSSCATPGAVTVTGGGPSCNNATLNASGGSGGII